eukprot:TRINITY_DN631_c8_g1_i1.p1 TRINITY_DN631_c8_g1~~TRINITY_DN631_c8_g1_i1.p1  ORF type:complete len:270 (-),score=15.65 TRINITY_DN631_c8_g1_i1:37-846(-)
MHKIFKIPLFEIFIFYFCFKAFHYVSKSNLITHHGLCIILTTLIIYEILYHIAALFTYYLDRTTSKEFKQKFKLEEKRKEPTYSKMASLVLRNQTIQFIFFVLLFYKYGSNWKFDERRETFAWTMFSFFVNLILTDWTFFGLHLMMHKVNKIYPIHKLHHSTYGTSGISAHYMSFLDFVMEVSSPGIVMFWLLLVPETEYFIGFSQGAFVILNCIAAFHTVFTHSGYHLPFLPDPVMHYIHHHQQIFNYGSFVSDKFMKTETNKLQQNS